MKVVATFHPPSSVVSTVKCRLASRDLEHLVVAKVNRVDVYSLQKHGLQHECGVDVWGKVLCVKAIPISVSLRTLLDETLIHLSLVVVLSGNFEVYARTNDRTS